MQFKAFKPEALNKIAGAMGYQGDMSQFQQFIEEDPQRKAQMDRYTNAARMMAKGGVVKMQTGGSATSPLGTPAAAVVVHDPNTGQTYGNYQQAINAGVANPAMGSGSLPMKTYPLTPGGGSGGIQAGLPGGPALGSPIGTVGTPPSGGQGTQSNSNLGKLFSGMAGPLQPMQGAANPPVTTATAPTATSTKIGDLTTQRIYQPALPTGGVTQAATTPITAGQELDPQTGMLTGSVAIPTALAQTAQATTPQQTQANLLQAQQAAPAIDAAMNAVNAAQSNPNDPRSQVTAAQQTATSVGNLQAAQGNSILINNPQQRQIQQGELISGTGIDATKAAQVTAQTQAAAATAQPSTQALVQTQLANLANQFQGTNPPAWAAGAIRTANAQMAARGLGASSLAGQAIVQAAMEASLPIAQADAGVIAQFEAQNLSNRQQSSMLAAEQRAKFMGMEFDQTFQAKVQNAARVADVANMNFTAEQQIALENSRIANTMNLQNLSNNQAMVMAEAAALSQLDVSNLNNRQQAAVQNAQNFMQIDMANLSNQQQTELFAAQQRAQSLFTDQAAENAARQFNASSQNQVDQFFAGLASQTSQFNAAQVNAQSQFNAGQANTVERFNAELNNQRDQFNAQNQLVIAQSNAQWRREIATADTAAINRANELNAAAILDVSKQAYDNLWTYYADSMEWAWKSAESELERLNNLAIANLSANAQADAQKAASKSAAGSALGSLIGTLGSAWIQFCWVAREVYGPNDYTWLLFRNWMTNKAPKWLYNLYLNKGEEFAKYISNKPLIKKVVKLAMDMIIKNHKMEYRRGTK